MFTIFNERSRAIHGETQEIYAKISVAMRKYIHLFRQNKDLNSWGVFTVIALHSDANGWSWPSTPTISQETGLISEEAISRSVKHLRTIKIEGHTLIHHYRQKHSNGQWGKSYYHVFPEAGGKEYPPVDNLILWEPPPVKPGVVNPVVDQGGDSLSKTRSKEKPELSNDLENPEGTENTPEYIKNAICILCYGTKDGWLTNASKIVKCYNDLVGASPMPTIDNLRKFYNWWYSVDWRGKKGQKPKPHQVTDEWPTAMAISTDEDSELFKRKDDRYDESAWR